ncbi:MAG: glycosyltransferase family 2 protein [Hyphomicrobiales bacterium]|nr:glycosyltransferase family 2 protein [Hyphomicrobiales bacterium]
MPETVSPCSSRNRNVALPLSIYIIARNEADRIGATIRAVSGLSDDIVVVDSGSTDDTVALATALGARVIVNAWPGYGLQKQFGEDQCRHDWLLNIDADEVVPPDMVEAIRALFATGAPAPAGYRLRIAEVFPGESKPHALAYADRVVMAPGAPIRRLAGTVAHYSVRSLGDQIAKLNAYSDQQVDDMLARGDGVSRLRMVLEFPANFIKAYVGRRHALRGTYGFMTAMNFAFYRYLRAAKYWERRLDRRGRSDD